MDHISSFCVAMKEIGLVPPSNLRTDGRCGRCHTEGKAKGKDGSYVLHLDNPINGWAKNWITGVEKTWKPDDNRPVTADDIKWFDGLKKEKKRETEKRKTDAIKDVRDIIANAVETEPDNSYLVRKKINTIGSLQDSTSLIIPIYELRKGKLIVTSLQRIFNNGDKRFHTGISTVGLFHKLGEINPSGLLYLVEGFATGSTVYQATSRKIPVVCALYAGNIKSVVEILQKEYPSIDIVIAADNDEKEGKKNIGLDTAIEVAEQNELSYCVPCIPGDFNDLYCLDNSYERVNKCLLDITSFRTNFDRYERDGEIGYTRASIMRIEPTKWLWEGRLLQGDINLLAGHPSTGKSTISTDLAARITSGMGWPGVESGFEPGNVGILSAEDSPERTTTPRFLAAGGNVDKLFIMESCIKNGDVTRTVNLKIDIDKLEMFCKRTNPVLVIIDPITSYLSGVDTHKTGDVRGALEPLSRLAKNMDISFLLITHFNKGGKNNSNQLAIERITGSNAFVALSRVSWVTLSEKKTDEDGNKYDCGLFLNAKCNVAEKPLGFEYRIKSFIVNNLVNVGKIEWEKETDEDVNVAMNKNSKKGGGKNNDDNTENDSDDNRIKEAKQWIAETVTGTEVESSVIMEEGKNRGYSRRLLFRVKDEMGIVARKVGKSWYWIID